MTGATGFIGAHVVRALLERGDEVRCLVREQSPMDNLRDLDVETVPGDLLDGSALARGLRGCSQAYHCAADYRLYAPDPKEMYRTNVAGAERLFDAASTAGVERVVFTSSVGTLGLIAGGIPADERAPVTLDDMVGHYKRSKFLAERAAERAARRLDLVIVNPSAPIGELDVRPTPTGQVIVDFLNRRLPATVDTGMNYVDVRDVAQGHLLAAERGRRGAKYILGHENMSLDEFLSLLADVSGLPAPRLRLPHWVPLAVATLQHGVARLTGREPRVALEAVRMARHRMYFDPGKAVSELNLPQSPIRPALERAVTYFREHGRGRGNGG